MVRKIRTGDTHPSMQPAVHALSKTPFLVTYSYPGNFETGRENGIDYYLAEPAFVALDVSPPYEQEFEELVRAILFETLPPKFEKATVDVHKRLYFKPNELPFFLTREWRIDITPYKGDFTKTPEERQKARDEALGIIMQVVERYADERYR